MKQAKTTSLIGVLLIVAGIGLALFTDFETTTLVIGIIMVIVGAIMFKSGKEKARKFCRKCNSSLNGCAYRWEETRRYIRNSSTYSNVRITSECPNCGATYTFSKEFCIYNDNTQTFYDIETLVNNYTYEKFGH